MIVAVPASSLPPRHAALAPTLPPLVAALLRTRNTTQEAAMTEDAMAAAYVLPISAAAARIRW